MCGSLNSRGAVCTDWIFDNYIRACAYKDIDCSPSSIISWHLQDLCNYIHNSHPKQKGIVWDISFTTKVSAKVIELPNCTSILAESRFFVHSKKTFGVCISTWEDALWSTYTLWFQDVKLDHQTSHPLTSASRKYWSCSLALMWRQPLLLAAIPLRPRWWSKHFQNICLAYYPIASMYGTCICLHLP